LLASCREKQSSTATLHGLSHMHDGRPRAASHAYWLSRYCHTNGCGL